MKSFRKTNFSVYLLDGARCRGAYYPGESEVLGLYIHGFRSSVAHRKSRFFLDHALQKGHSWANFDLPCHGRSEGLFQEFRLSDALEAVLAVLEELRDVPVLMVGSSMGAWLAMLAAQKLARSTRAKNVITGALLIAPAFDFFKHYFQNRPPEELVDWQRKRVRRFVDPYDNRPYDLDYRVLRDAQKFTLLESPAQWEFPVRIYHGTQDEVAPVAHSRKFRELAKKSDVRLYEVDGGDHSLDAYLPRVAAAVDRMFAAAHKHLEGK